MRSDFCTTKLLFGLALMLHFASGVAVGQEAGLITNQTQLVTTDIDEKWFLDDPSTSNEQPSKEGLSNNSIRKVGSSLAIVLGLFSLVSLVMRRQKPAGQTTPLIETLGQVHLTPKVKLHLVRFGQRLLVLHVSPGTVQRIAEITDPAEVAQMLGEPDAGQVADSLNQHPSVEELLQAVGKVQPARRFSGTGGQLA